MLLRVADPEHPAVAFARAHAAAHLVGQRLKREMMIRLAERAQDRAVRPASVQDPAEPFDRAFEPPRQKILEAVVGDAPRRGDIAGIRKEEAAGGVEKQRRADPLVEVRRVAPE